jgi:hypothetical protein
VRQMVGQPGMNVRQAAKISSSLPFPLSHFVAFSLGS